MPFEETVEAIGVLIKGRVQWGSSFSRSAGCMFISDRPPQDNAQELIPGHAPPLLFHGRCARSSPCAVLEAALVRPPLVRRVHSLLVGSPAACDRVL